MIPKPATLPRRTLYRVSSGAIRKKPKAKKVKPKPKG